MAVVHIVPLQEFRYERSPKRIVYDKDTGEPKEVGGPELFAPELDETGEPLRFEFEEHQARNIIAKGLGIAVDVRTGVVIDNPDVLQAYEAHKAALRAKERADAEKMGVILEPEDETVSVLDAPAAMGANAIQMVQPVVPVQQVQEQQPVQEPVAEAKPKKRARG